MMTEEIAPSPLRAALPLLTGLRRFWLWWTGELAALVPTQWRGPPPLLLHLGPTSTLVSGLDMPLRFDAPLAELSPQQAAQLQQAAQGRRIDVAITQPVLRLPVQLPLAAERSLASALRYQLMSASPAPVDDIVYDHRLLARDKAQGKLDVQVALITLAQLAGLNDTLARLNLAAQRIGAVEPGGSHLVYLFQRRNATVSDDPARRARLWLGASALMLLLLLPLLHFGASSWARRLETQSYDMHRTLKPKLAQRSAAQALALQAPLLTQRLRTPAATAQLAAIIAAHGKEDWAEAISVTPKQLRLEAHTADPQSLRTRLEAQRQLAGWRWRVLPSQTPNALTVLEANR
jgi:general secretion pathway protein L